jgi:predicted dehydrogenase
VVVKIGQLGTRHGHAEGKWLALRSHPDVDAVGVWEPDPAQRAAAQDRAGFAGARFFASADELLCDPTVLAVAVEGRNHESLAMAQAAIDCGKHLWFDKPAGDDWTAFNAVMRAAAERGLYVQMGYMFRYSPGFEQIARWVHGGVLGDVFAIRAHMSTNVDLNERTQQSRHRGGILYDLAGHMLDQIVWLLGRPNRVTSIVRNDATPELPNYADNTLAVLEFNKAVVMVDIAAMEPRPAARRFEVYGTRGSAILEPFDPARTIRLVLAEPVGELASGEQTLRLPETSRQQLYERELAAFVGLISNKQPADRSPAHELLVQETLLRATGALPGEG